MSLKSVLHSRSDLGQVVLEVAAGSAALPLSMLTINEKKKKRRLKMSSLILTRFSNFSNRWCSKRIKKLRLVRMCELTSKPRRCSSPYSPTGVSSRSDLSITYTSELSLTCSSASLTA